MEAVSLQTLVIAAVAVVVSLGLAYGWKHYQSCPHCGRIVRRAQQGWLRCTGCGRQYRKGLRIR